MAATLQTDILAGSRPDPTPRTYRLSFAQRRLWFLDRLDPGKAVYNISESLRLTGALDPNQLARAVNEIVRRHDALRTTFEEMGGNPVQVVAPALAIEISMETFAHLAAEQREREAALWIGSRANQPFDLKHGPLIRASLAQLDAQEHILLVGMHHIIAEGGWSMSIFLGELAALYNAGLRGQSADLPEVPIQYGDYSVWQHDWMQGEVRDSLLDYWKKHLEGAPAVLDLPADRPRPSRQTYSGSRESRRLPATLKTALSDFSKAQGATLFMTLLSGFNTLLARYTSQEDLVVGASVAGRGSPETHHLIGFFANTLALRSDLRGDPSFRELLRRTKDVCLAAYDHEDLPYELLVEALNPERSLAYSPLFQVMLAYQNAPREELRLAGLKVSAVPIETSTSMFDLTLFVWERPDGILVTAEYSTDLFERATIRNLLRHFEILLTAAMAAPETAVSKLPFLDPAERDRILIEWNSTGASYPEIPLQQLIEAQVKSSPDAVAVECGERSLTYAELNRRANQLAAHLRSLGAGPDKIVGICLERSVDLVIALLAVVKTGGAYLPLDPHYPGERLRLIAQDAGIDILIADGDVPYAGQIVKLDWDALGPFDHANPCVQVTGDHLAYVLYTSGSTGSPKGVAIPRKALANLLHSMREHFGLTPSDTILGVTTLSFDIAGADIWLPLITGARLILADRDTMLDGQRLQSEIATRGITFLQATPSTWRLLLDSGWNGKSNLQAGCTGEAMPKDLAQRLFPLVGRLWNLYGPTETTIWSTAYQITNPDDAILIGRPIANTQTYILDRNLAPVPPGVSGELWIGGDGLARGYLHQDELTAERFIPNPFGPNSSSPNSSKDRIYKTGDLARFRPDGNIECLGRNDHQIKLRGFRIEPEEIRAALLRHPAIRDAAAVLDSGATGPRIVAYLAPANGDRPAPAELRDCVRRSLPDYMIPAAFVFLDALPLTPNGKIDRKALPAPEALSAPSEFAAPETELEARLAAIWENVLEVRPIGMTDDFFDLGGHSLKAAELFREINFSYNLDLPLATLFHAPTVRRLAALISESDLSQMSAPIVEIQPRGSRPRIYCIGALDGEVIVFRRLAREFGSDQPLYGLQPFQLLGPVPTVPQIAAAYIEQLRASGESQPFCLLGYSSGGLVAVEMARQLQAQGVRPPIVTMVDTGYPAGCRAQESWEQRMRRIQWVRSKIKNEGWSFLFHRIDNAINRVAHRASSKIGVPLSSAPRDVRKLQTLAGESYRIKSYDGRVHLFRAGSRREFLQGGEELGWSGILSDLVIDDVPGDHGSMYTGVNLKILAAKLAAAISAPACDAKALENSSR